METAGRDIMGILNDKTCPKCHAKDALVICVWTGAVNCSECTETIRFLTKEEKGNFLENLEEMKKKTGVEAMAYLRRDQ